MKEKDLKQISLEELLLLITSFQNNTYESEDQMMQAATQRLENSEIISRQIFHELQSTTGWSNFKILGELTSAMLLYNISPRNYCQYKAYMISKKNFKEEFDTRVAERKKERAELKERKNKNVIEQRRVYIQTLMAKTGWTREKVVTEIKDARERTGCWAGQYLYFRFWELSHEEQATYLTQDYSNKISRQFDVNPYFNKLLTDKERTNYFFSDFVKRPWCVNTKVSEKEFMRIFENTDRIFYKPLHDHHGNGAEAIDLSKDNWQSVYNRLKGYEEGVVEGYVLQHKKMSALAPNAVNTLRIVTLSSLTRDIGAPGVHRDLVYVSLKLSGETGCVDNLAGGGMVAGVDIDTGRVSTDAVDENEHIYSHHPVTGMQIKGFEIPFFRDAITMVFTAIDRYKLEGYLGWDVAVTDNGPELIETNTIPGTVLGQLPYVPEKKGVRCFLERLI